MATFSSSAGSQRHSSALRRTSSQGSSAASLSSARRRVFLFPATDCRTASSGSPARSSGCSSRASAWLRPWNEPANHGHESDEPASVVGPPSLAQPKPHVGKVDEHLKSCLNACFVVRRVVKVPTAFARPDGLSHRPRSHTPHTRPARRGSTHSPAMYPLESHPLESEELPTPTRTFLLYSRWLVTMLGNTEKQPLGPQVRYASQNSNSARR